MSSRHRESSLDIGLQWELKGGAQRGSAQDVGPFTVYHPLGGRGFVCFGVWDHAHWPGQKQNTRHLYLQADDETTEDSGEVTTNPPDEETTEDSGEVTTNPPDEETTEDSGEVTTNPPDEETTEDPVEVTTNKPDEETTKDSGEVTTNPPDEETTEESEVTTNEPDEGTEAPDNSGGPTTNSIQALTMSSCFVLISLFVGQKY